MEGLGYAGQWESRAGEGPVWWAHSHSRSGGTERSQALSRQGHTSPWRGSRTRGAGMLPPARLPGAGCCWREGHSTWGSAPGSPVRSAPSFGQAYNRSWSQRAARSSPPVGIFMDMGCGHCKGAGSFLSILAEGSWCDLTCGDLGNALLSCCNAQRNIPDSWVRVEQG